MTYVVRESRSEADAQAITALRREIFELELGHAYGAMCDDLDEYSTNFVVEFRGEIIAGARFTVRADGPLEDEAELELEQWTQAFADTEIGQCSRLFVVRRHRGEGIVGDLAAQIHEVAMQRGVALVFVDAEPKLVDYYREHGFHAFRPGYVHRVLGHVYVPLVRFVGSGEPAMNVGLR